MRTEAHDRVCRHSASYSPALSNSYEDGIVQAQTARLTPSRYPERVTGGIHAKARLFIGDGVLTMPEVAIARSSTIDPRKFRDANITATGKPDISSRGFFVIHNIDPKEALPRTTHVAHCVRRRLVSQARGVS